MFVKTKMTLKPDAAEEVCPGLICEWYFGHRIIAYRLTQAGLPLFTQWAEYVIARLTEWPEDQPYLAMHDLSQPGISLQYASLTQFDTINVGVLSKYRRQAVDLVVQRLPAGAQVAINFNLSLSGKVNKTLADRRDRSTAIDYRTFYNPERALDWLAAPLNDNGQGY